MRRFLVRLANFFRREQAEREMVREINAHLALLEDDFKSRGLPSEEAKLAALRSYGGVEQSKELHRDARSFIWLEQSIKDLRYAIRGLLRTPAFTVTAVVTLALGIGANTAIFSILNSTVLKPVPFPDANRLVLVWATYGKGPDNWNIVSAPNFRDFQRLSRSFESMSIFNSSGKGYNLSPAGGGQEAEQVAGLRVSAGFFPVLGARPLLGRTFLPEEEIPGRDHVVVLSYGLWKSRYNGDPTLVGKTIRMDGAEYTVIGVMAREFEWQFWSRPQRLWVPIGYTKSDYDRTSNSFVVIARLKPGVSMDQARAEMETIGKSLAAQYPKEDANMGATVTPLAEFETQGLRTTMLTLLAAVAFVLLIACANVANLLLVRSAGRHKEFAIRLALGASGSRLARQLLTENILLALAGGAAGLVVAVASARVLFHTFQLGNLDLPMRPIDSIAMDGRVLAFALAITFLTALLFGVRPAAAALRTNVNSRLKEGGRTPEDGSHNRARQALMAIQVALAMVVLSGAGLMIKSMTRLLGVDPGFDPKNVLTMQMAVPQRDTFVGPPELPRFCQDLEEHVGAIPGVVSVAAVAHLPFRGNAGRGFQIEGRPPAEPGDMPGADYSVACPNYFRTMGIPVVKGREFTARDTESAPAVIVINETMARSFWPNENPVGRVMRLGGSDGPRLMIVGVVGDVHHVGLDRPVRRQFFRPYPQAGWPVMQVVIRSASAPGAYAAPVKAALASVLPDWPASGFETMEVIVRNSTGSRRFPMLLLIVFSALALALAAVGIAGVVGHSVAQRTQEIGIRMALGAKTLDVLGLVVNRSMAWVLAGLAAGFAGSAALTRLLTRMLYEVRPLDPAVLGGVALLLGSVALGASYWPARRAAKINPIAALRCE